MGPFIDKVNSGSYKYGGKDLVYDQIIVSAGLADSIELSFYRQASVFRTIPSTASGGNTKAIL